MDNGQAPTVATMNTFGNGNLKPTEIPIFAVAVRRGLGGTIGISGVCYLGNEPRRGRNGVRHCQRRLRDVILHTPGETASGTAGTQPD